MCCCLNHVAGDSQLTRHEIYRGILCISSSKTINHAFAIMDKAHRLALNILWQDSVWPCQLPLQPARFIHGSESAPSTDFFSDTLITTSVGCRYRKFLRHMAHDLTMLTSRLKIDRQRSWRDGFPFPSDLRVHGFIITFMFCPPDARYVWQQSPGSTKIVTGNICITNSARIAEIHGEFDDVRYDNHDAAQCQ